MRLPWLVHAVIVSCLLLAWPAVVRAADGYGKNLPIRLPAPGSRPLTTKVEADCEVPILAAERRYAIPTGLLLAIAVVETGRPDQRLGQKRAWPWTVNAAGQGQYFEDRAAAVKWVVQAQTTGMVSIDVGCLQVNLAAHPTAFRSVADGFDPALNADFAARFLVSLFRESGDWQAAVGTYHSRTPALAVPYRDQVGRQYANAGAADRLFVQSVVAQRALLLRQLRLAWSATLPPPVAASPHADADIPTRRSFP